MYEEVGVDMGSVEVSSLTFPNLTDKLVKMLDLNPRHVRAGTLKLSLRDLESDSAVIEWEGIATINSAQLQELFDES